MVDTGGVLRVSVSRDGMGGGGNGGGKTVSEEWEDRDGVVLMSSPWHMNMLTSLALSLSLYPFLALSPFTVPSLLGYYSAHSPIT